jgi:hypothetical protein
MNVLNSRVAAADRGEEAKRDWEHSHLDSSADVLNLGLYQRGRMGGPATTPRFRT